MFGKGRLDASAAVAALERSQAILSNVGDRVFSTDPEGRILLWNRAAERVIGCPTKKAQGRSCASVLGLEAGGELLDCTNGCALMNLVDGKAPSASVEVERKRKGGSRQPLLINDTPITDGTGDVSEYVHSLRDITALKQADEAKTMFLATASHELKTPLTVILGFTQALSAGWLDDVKRKQALEAIERRAQELSRIVDRLLLTGRIESGRVALDLKVVALADMIADRATGIAMATGREVACVLPPELPDVIADPDALTSVVDHLLDNAVKYSPGGGEVRVQASSGRSNVEIEITDHGIGMTSEEVARCFDRFWQAEASDVRRFGGTGVGLYIVRSLAEAMGGSVRVRSDYGEGSTFVVVLRRATEEDRSALAEASGEPGQGQPTMIQEFMHQLGVPRAPVSAGGGGE
jgi:PAS domain S-box-containing protein